MLGPHFVLCNFDNQAWLKLAVVGIGKNMACARVPTGFVDKWATLRCVLSLGCTLCRFQLIKVEYEMQFQPGAEATIIMDAITNSGSRYICCPTNSPGPFWSCFRPLARRTHSDEDTIEVGWKQSLSVEPKAIGCQGIWKGKDQCKLLCFGWIEGLSFLF